MNSHDTGEDTVTLARADYDALLEHIEDLEDALKLKEAIEHPETREYLPVELVDRMIAGEHPLRIWREHRGLTLQSLSDRSGVGFSYIAEIERGKKPGSVDAVRKLAAALGIEIDDLIKE